jgi:hypothetical protein
MNYLLLVLFSLVALYFSLNYLDRKLRNSIRLEILNNIYNSFDREKILEITEILDIEQTPFKKDELTPNFSGFSNWFNYHFYFKIRIEEGSKIIIKWVTAFYIFKIKIFYTVK